MMDKEQFSQLYNKYLEGNLSPEEEQAFYRAVQEGHFDDELHALAGQSWEESKVYQQPPAEDGLLRIGKVMEKIRPVQKRHIPYWRWVAAASIVLIVASLVIYKQKPAPSAPLAILHKIVTAAGEKRVVYLPDSSVVHMNAGTTLIYHDNTPRNITLSGEAFFNVTHNPDQSFTVASSDSVRTRVLGTSFNIKNYPNESKINISVVTGKVSVSRNNTPLAIMVKDMELVFDRQSATTHVERSNWRKGVLAFEFNTLQEVVACLERTYDCRIHIDKGVAFKRKLNARFEETLGVKAILALIGDLYELDIIYKGKKEIEIYNKPAGGTSSPAAHND
jgi:transmembrane sensor